MLMNSNAILQDRQATVCDELGRFLRPVNEFMDMIDNAIGIPVLAAEVGEG